MRYGPRFQDLLVGAQTWGQRSVIKSIQSGTVLIPSGSATGTATITAVNLRNAIILYNGQWTPYTGSGAGRGRLTLTNSTTVTGDIDSNIAADVTLSYVVLEFVPGVIKTIQAGTFSIANLSASGTATITAVNTAKAHVLFLGDTFANNVAMDSAYIDVELTNATTVTGKRSNTTTAHSVGYMVVEYY